MSQMHGGWGELAGLLNHGEELEVVSCGGDTEGERRLWWQTIDLDEVERGGKRGGQLGVRC